MKNLLFTIVLAFISISLFGIVPPVLNSPADGAVNQMPDAELNWYPVSGIGTVSYELQIDLSDQFLNPIIYTLNVSAKKGENLSFNQTYFWRVRASDQTGLSNWSETYSFTVFNRLTLNKPDNGDTAKMPNAELSWKSTISNLAITGIDRFEIQIDTAYNWHVVAANVVPQTLNSVYFNDETKGWAVGESGKIVAFNNGNWHMDTLYYITSNSTIADTTINTSLKSINNGFIVGTAGTFIEYQDSIWVLGSIVTKKSGKSIMVTDDLYSVYALSSDDVWVVSKGGKIFHRDASQNWQVITNVTTKDLNSVFFVDENHGWAVGKGGTIIAYNEGTWAVQTSNVLKDLFGVSFTDLNHGWAVGKLGTILFYNGNEWVATQSNSIKDLNSISMIGQNEGWACGLDGILVYYDGSDWVETTSNSTKTLNTIFAYSSDYVWTVGLDGTVITKYGGSFNSPLSELLSTSAVNFKINTEYLHFNTRYFWRIRAIHATDTSGWSPARFFTTIAGVSLLLPDQNAVDQMPNINLTWNPVTGIFNYIYQVCTDPDFTFPCITGFTQNTNIKIPGLEFDKVYYWRIKAAHYTDTTDWSQARNFTIINTVYLTSPAQGANAGLVPLLVWNWINGADQYELRYFTENLSFIDTVFSDTSNFKVYKPLTPLTTYFWKVRAFRDGDTTNWSATWSFTSTVPQGIENYLNDKNISLYPNPVNDKLNIELNLPGQSEIQISLSDLLGQAVIEQRFMLDQGVNIKTLDLKTLNKGLYILKIQSESSSFSKKIIVDR